MLKSLQARQPGASLKRILWWYAVQAVCYVWVNLCYRYRVWGLNNLPRTGPVLLLSNHQSFLDPVLIGVACHYRQCHAMARSTLFKNQGFAWLIRSLNAFPVERGTTDMAAMRRAIQVLQEGHALLVFPEGTRTPDGTTKPLASGTMLLIKRAKPAVVPVAVEGAFDVWPKARKLPRGFGTISVAIGEPIPAERLLKMGQQPALDHLQNQIESMRLTLADRRRSGR